MQDLEGIDRIRSISQEGSTRVWIEIDPSYSPRDLLDDIKNRVDSINTFPAEKQNHVRTMLSTSLRGVISQQLVPKAQGEGLVAALEIMVNTPAVANVIRQGKLDQLENAMTSGRKVGMITMDATLKDMLSRGVITGEAAYNAAIDKLAFEDTRQVT